MKNVYQRLTWFLDREKIDKRDVAIFLVVGVATALNELSIQMGIAVCTSPLITFAVLFIFLKYIFPKKTEE